MSSSTPYAGLSADRLVAMIHQDNQNAIRPGTDFIFGVPLAGSYVGEDGVTRNTQLRLTPAPGSMYRAPQDIHYIRLDISALTRLPEGFVETVSIPSVPFTIHGILPQINAALGLNLLPAEVHDQTYTEELESYELRINGSVSLAWVESTYVFAAQIVNPAIPLAQVIPLNDLSGLVYLQPAA